MSATSLHVVLRRLCAAAVHDEADSRLVQRFVAQRDEAAFAALVRRHGPMVLSVCRRVLGCMHDAEDAFQATFLVLARKAASIRKKESLSSWLHGVAFHLASKLRARDAVRRRHESLWHGCNSRGTPGRATPGVETAWRELQELLDGELQRLPAKYRMPLVLCYLEDRTHDEAARQLGWPVGTVKSRLSKARDLLRARLEQRGLALSASAFAVALAASAAAAALPATVCTSVIRAGIAVAAGQLAGGIVSSAALALADSMLRTSAALKAKLAALVLLALGMGAAIGYQLPAGGGRPEDEAKQRTDEPKAESRKQKADLHGDPLPPGALARLGTTRWRQNSYASAGTVAFSADGKSLFTANYLGEVVQWDSANGKRVRQVLPEDPDIIKNPELFIPCIDLLADGRTIAFGGHDGSIRLVDVPRGQVRQRCEGHDGLVNSVALSADGRVLISRGNDLTLRVWDATTGKELNRRFVGKTPPAYLLAHARSVALSRDGKTLAWIERDGKMATIHVCETGTGKELYRLTGHEQTVQGVAFSPDGQRLASVGNLSPVRLWDLKTGQPIPTFQDKHGHDSCYVAFSPDGKWMATSQYNDPVRLLDAGTGKELWRVPIHPQSENGFVFSPDSKTLVVAGRQQDPLLRRYDVATGKEILNNDGHGGPIVAVAFSPDGRIVTSIGDDNALRRWETDTGKLLQTNRIDKNWFECALSEDGRWLGVVGEQTAGVYSTHNGKELWLRSSGKSRPVTPVFSADGRWAAIAEGDNRIVVCEAETGKEVRRLQDLVRESGLHGFSPDGQSLISCAMTSRSNHWEYDCQVVVWDVATCRKRRVLDLKTGFSRPLLSPDGKTLILAAEGNEGMDLWEMATGNKRLHIPLNNLLQSVCLTPDGRALILCSVKKRVESSAGAFRGYDIRTGELLFEQPGHRGPVIAFAVSRDGRWLATGGWDTTILIWNLEKLRVPLQTVKLEAAESTSSWAHLASADAAKAYGAIVQLTANPEQAVKLVNERVRPAAAPEPRHLAQQIADLDNEQFAVREQAAKELEALDELAEPALRQALDKSPSAEARRRLERLLAKLESGVSSGERLRALRAVEVLEQIATPEARQLLRKLAEGTADARLTQEAKASLRRLQLRHPAP